MVKGKTVDKWKTKQWYTVFAPEIFDNKEIGEIPTSDEDSLKGRIIRVTLADLIGDISQSYVTIKFRVTEVKGKSAQTKLIGHELGRGYLRTLVRRGKTIINEVLKVKTKDGVPITIKLSVLTARKVSKRLAADIRAIIRTDISEKGKEMDFSQLEQEIIFGKFPARVFNKIKKLAPIKRVEIRKTEVGDKQA